MYHLFNTYLSGSYYVPGIILGTGDSIVKKKDTVLALKDFIIHWGNQVSNTQ